MRKLKELGVFSLERLFLREDMIQVYSMCTSLDIDNNEINKFFIVDHGGRSQGD